MHLWLLKFLPIGKILPFLKDYWKPILVVFLFVAYSLTLSTIVKNNINDKWELKEAARVEQELKAELKASQDAAKLKEQQDARELAAREKLKADKEAAEKREQEALADLRTQRRENNASTAELKKLQQQARDSGDDSGFQPVNDGVRDTLNSLQDKVRSRRHP